MPKNRKMIFAILFIMTLLISGKALVMPKNTKAASTEQSQSLVFADGKFGARIVADRTTVKTGDEITFTVYSNGSKNYTYFGTVLEYNNDYFEISRHLRASNAWSSHMPGPDKDEWNVFWDGDDSEKDSISSGEKIGSISFKVKKEFTEAEISFYEVTYLSPDYENYYSLGYGDFIPDEKYTFHFKYDESSSYCQTAD